MFSRFKKIILKICWAIPVLFWIFFLFVLISSFRPIYKIIDQINHLENEYYSFNFSNDSINYIREKNKPLNWVDYNSISKNLINAVVVSEDGKFFYHHGHDLEQIQKVILDKYIYKKKKVRGASTITQQLIKNLFLSKEKTVSRKVVEFILADYMESKVSKRKILETYLNIIEYGPGIYGIENASKFYFQKRSKDLSPRESAFIAMLLPSPKKYSKSFFNKELTPFARKIIDSVLLKMNQGGFISYETYESNVNGKLNFELHQIADLNSNKNTNDIDDTENLDLYE